MEAKMPHSHVQKLPLRSPSGFFARLLISFATIALRRRERRQLARLDAHLLRDIGLDAPEAEAECAKPFWRP
jgi:uncharacterized protein YjiS (DUF1127 family)